MAVDLSIYTDVALLDAAVSGDADAYDELRDRLGADEWPQETFEVARATFGDAVYNRKSRTFQALDRRVRHCRRTWREKFGPLNAEQEAYADTIIAHALRVGARDAGGDRKLLWPYCQNAIGRLVNHEDVYAGFKRRADRDIDVTAVLRELAA